MAYVRGTYDMKIAMSDTMTVSDRGKFLEIRKRQPDGSWLIHRDIFNSDLAAGH
jgi:ketosteroid isomerase-like protein